MNQLHDWLDRKIKARRRRLRVSASATDTFRRHVGPRNLFGQVTLSAVPASEFSYVSRVTWPVGEQVQLYEDCVLDGILIGNLALKVHRTRWIGIVAPSAYDITCETKTR